MFTDCWVPTVAISSLFLLAPANHDLLGTNKDESPTLTCLPDVLLVVAVTWEAVTWLAVTGAVVTEPTWLFVAAVPDVTFVGPLVFDFAAAVLVLFLLVLGATVAGALVLGSLAGCITEDVVGAFVLSETCAFECCAFEACAFEALGCWISVLSYNITNCVIYQICIISVLY